MPNEPDITPGDDAEATPTPPDPVGEPELPSEPAASGAGGLSNTIDQAELDAIRAAFEAAQSEGVVNASASSVRHPQPPPAPEPSDDDLAAEMAAAIAAEAAASAAAHAPSPQVLGDAAIQGRAEHVAPFDPPALDGASTPAGEAAIDLLDDVELEVRIELGRAEMYIEDVIRLGVGSVVELDRLAGDPVDIFVNNRLIARGEVLVLNDNFCVRINSIQSPIPELETA